MRFVLIHGGFHGAWCWERTIAELEQLGHEAMANRNAEDGRFEADPVGMFRHLQKADNGGMEFGDFDATRDIFTEPIGPLDPD